jgi:hypothetical protein
MRNATEKKASAKSNKVSTAGAIMHAILRSANQLEAGPEEFLEFMTFVT